MRTSTAIGLSVLGLRSRAWLALVALLALVACQSPSEQPAMDPPEAIETGPPEASRLGDGEPTTPESATGRVWLDRQPPEPIVPEPFVPVEEPADFSYEVERFADKRILRYRVPGFETLAPSRRVLLYYLQQAALAGRDILYDQKHSHNLAIRRTIEQLLRAYPGDRTTAEWRALEEYAREIWFANGIHHHSSHEKFTPGFSYERFAEWVLATDATFPARPGRSREHLLEELRPILFDSRVDAKLIQRADDTDLVRDSASNFYEGVSRAQVESFYASRLRRRDPRPVAHGLNSTLVRGSEGALREEVWKLGGRYTAAIEEMIVWLERAARVAENPAQRDAIEALIRYYVSGDLGDWDAYNVLWVKDRDSVVELVHGFIDVRNDPIGMRGSYEAVVSLRDPIATARVRSIAEAAPRLEERLPIDDAHRRTTPQGIDARVIHSVVHAGDASPEYPTGFSLPKSRWIREEYGSKNVTLTNIIEARAKASGASTSEFAWDYAEVERARKYGELARQLRTELREVVGRAVGKLEPGIAPPRETLGEYAGVIEEARAELVALYCLPDPRFAEIGIPPTTDVTAAAYDAILREGLLMQLRQVPAGGRIEDDALRARATIARYVQARGQRDGVVDRRQRDGKTYFTISDHDRLRALFGELLGETQRILSQGDGVAARSLVEKYGTTVDPKLQAEVVTRFESLGIPAFTGFLNPRIVPVERDGVVIDARIEYPDDFEEQMLEYADTHSFLPTWN